MLANNQEGVTNAYLLAIDSVNENKIEEDRGGSARQLWGRPVTKMQKRERNGIRKFKRKKECEPDTGG